jgi:hypothetical protein
LHLTAPAQNNNRLAAASGAATIAISIAMIINLIMSIDPYRQTGLISVDAIHGRR